jgi:serine/threonine protein kinase
MIAESPGGIHGWAEAEVPDPSSASSTSPLASVPPELLPCAPVDCTESNLRFFHNSCQFEQLVGGQFAKVKTLQKAIHGKVYLMRWIGRAEWSLPIPYGEDIELRISQALGREVRPSDIVKTAQDVELTVNQLRELRGDELTISFPILVKKDWSMPIPYEEGFELRIRQALGREARPDVDIVKTAQDVELTVNQLRELRGDELTMSFPILVKKDSAEVAVKQMPSHLVDQTRSAEPNERESHWRRSGLPPIGEDGLNEIGVLQQLSRRRRPCQYILRHLGTFRDANTTYLATTSCGGELFDLISNEPDLPERGSVRLIWQLLQAVSYLHCHNIGHRDVSLENILVLEKGVGLENATLQLMDFGQACQLRALDERRTRLRYFRAAGKHSYRPPEAYVPQPVLLEVPCPAGGAGRIISLAGVTIGRDGYPILMVKIPDDAVDGNTCRCELAGYEAAPFDMFSVGVTLFIMLIKNTPWKNALPIDRSFGFIQQRGLQTLLTAWGKHVSPDAVNLMELLLRVDPVHRATLLQALDHRLFHCLRDP